MLWNWQKQNWRDFVWNSDRLRLAEQRFLLGGGLLLGSLDPLEDGDRKQIEVELLLSEALTTSEIEGETLDRLSVQSSIRQRLGLTFDNRNVESREYGIAEMTVYALNDYAGLLREETLFDWHKMLMNGRRDLSSIGQYRTHIEPMQVVSGRADKPKVYFEAPPSALVPAEMTQFVEWFNASEKTMSALARAGIAHLYFASVHPFEDGNGRISRALAEKALRQAIGQPLLLALSPTILIRRKQYYDALEAANKSNEITAWLLWFAGTVLEAQTRTLSEVAFIQDKVRMLDLLRGRLNERQEKALLRMFRAGPGGFLGGLTAAKYMAITGAPHATATRDLADLTEKEALTRQGELKGTRYFLKVPIRPTPHIVINEHGEITEA